MSEAQPANPEVTDGRPLGGEGSAGPQKERIREMRPTTVTDPVGANEIAERLGVTTATVHSWRHRASDERPRATAMPDPDIIVTKTPIWSWKRILDWALETNRVPATGSWNKAPTNETKLGGRAQGTVISK